MDSNNGALFIRITRPCVLYPLASHIYIVKLGCTEVYIILGCTEAYIIFLIFAQEHRLWVLVMAVLTCTHNLFYERKKNKNNISIFHLKITILVP